jgi:hypothetical protein
LFSAVTLLFPQYFSHLSHKEMPGCSPFHVRYTNTEA